MQHFEDTLSQGHYQPKYQQARKWFNHFITSLTFMRNETARKKPVADAYLRQAL